VLVFLSTWMQGCEIKKKLQDFVDTHAEVVCVNLYKAGVRALSLKAMQELDTKCNGDQKCKDCGANGLEDARKKEQEEFVVACAKAAKNVFNDTDAAKNFGNDALPAYVNETKLYFDNVVKNPEAFCATDPVSAPVARLFQLLPGRSEASTSAARSSAQVVIMGFAALTFVTSVVIGVRRNREAGSVVVEEQPGDMECALRGDSANGLE